MARADAQSDGFVLIYRGLVDHPVFNDEPEAWAFASLIRRAAWKPTRVRYKEREIVLERGQVAMSVRDFAVIWGRSKSWAQRFFDKLEEAGMVEKKRDGGRDRRGTASGTAVNVLSICNYDKYQVVQPKGGTVTDQKVGQERDTEQYKERRKEKKEEKYIGDLLDKIPAKPNGFAKPWAGGDDIPDEYVQWSVGTLGWSRRDTVAEGQRFVDDSLAHRRKYADWKRAWQKWCRSQYQTTKPKNAGIGPA